jgi:ABC-type Mn2+/Zn2+ transport system permease subunit
MQAVPIGFMRGVVGIIGVGCAHMLARAVVALRRGEVRISRMYAWLIRTVLCMLALWYPARPDVDREDAIIWLLAVVGFGLGYWDASRVKKQEDLTHEIFPDDSEGRDGR